MKIVTRFLNDVLLLEPKVFFDGLSTEIIVTHQELSSVGITGRFVQDNHSCSMQNVLRGLHYQIEHPQGKLIRVLTGCIFDVAVDLRRASPAFGQSAIIELKTDDNLLLWIPPGYAHGFLVLDGPSEVAYSVTDYRYAEHERTLSWCDADLAIPWPLGQQSPTLSDKDRLGAPFARCECYP